MTRLEALKELAEKVEAGEFPGGIDGAARKIWPYNQREADDLGLTAALAFDGSLDAALALHEAVLPGWGWLINGYRGYASVWVPEDDSRFPDGFQSIDPVPARAWLLAILRALIAQEEAQ